MTKPAAIRADFADFRQVKSRKVAQLIFEVPLEQLPEVMQVLGWPRPDGNIPVGIARLVAEIGPDLKAEKSADKPVTPSASGEGQDIRRTYSRSQMAAILCQDGDFCRWLFSTYSVEADGLIDEGIIKEGSEYAASAPTLLRFVLLVDSRSELDTDPLKGEAWDKLYNSFKYRDVAR
jgi:hypothetical protein